MTESLRHFRAQAQLVEKAFFLYDKTFLSF